MKISLRASNFRISRLEFSNFWKPEERVKPFILV